MYKKGLEDLHSISLQACAESLINNENKLGLKNKIKGEEKLIKVIVKNKETGEQKCIDIPKERENDSDIKALRIGMIVYYRKPGSRYLELIEVVKIIDDRPKPGTVLNYIPMVFDYQTSFGLRFGYSKGAGRATFTKQFLDKQEGERKERKKYQEKPYFGVRLDIIKGKPDSKENLDKMKFPCWVVYRHGKDGKRSLGQLVTGFSDGKLEYQLVDMMEQVPVGECSTISREYNLKVLMDRLYIEVIKGQTQLWKVGGFSV